MFNFFKRLFGKPQQDLDAGSELSSSVSEVDDSSSCYSFQETEVLSSCSRGDNRTSSVLSCPHPADYVILDTETTGLSPYTDQIIQISAIRYNEQGVPSGFFNTLINPGCPISPYITQINGITNHMVSDAPCIDQVGDIFLAFLGNSLLVGYNVTFDLRFLDQAFPGVFPGRNYVDALSLSRRALALPSYKLEAVASEIGFCPEGAFHDSFTDCETVAAILRHIEADLSLCILEFNSPRTKQQSNPDPVPQDRGLAFWRKGEALRKDGHFEEAIKLFDRAKKVGYTCPVLYESYAMIYRREGKFEEEISILEEGLKHYPGGPIGESFLDRKTKAQARLAARIRKEEELHQKQEAKSRKEAERQLKRELEAAKPKQASRRPVLKCSDDGTVLQEFASLADASRVTGVSPKCIRDAANGKQKHAGGYCWKYQDIQSKIE